MTLTTWLIAIGIFYAGMLVGILVSALCVAASDTRARHHAGLLLITRNPLTGETTRTVIDRQHAEN